jgi:hypothetical protein
MHYLLWKFSNGFHSFKMEQTTVSPTIQKQPESNNSEQTLPTPQIEEIGGTAGPEPTRYGDWEKNGRCIDF